MIVKDLRGFGAGTVWTWNGSGYSNSGPSSTGSDQYLGGPQADAAPERGTVYEYIGGEWTKVGVASGPEDEYRDQGLKVTPGSTTGVASSTAELATTGAGLLTTIINLFSGKTATPPAYYPPPVPKSNWVLPVAIGGGVLVLVLGFVALRPKSGAVAGYRLRRSRR